MPMNAFRYFCRNIGIPALLFSAATALIAIYLNAYSLHRFVIADYAGFRKPLGANQSVTVDGWEIDFRLPVTAFSIQTIDEVRAQVNQAEGTESRIAKAAWIVRNALRGGGASLPTGYQATAEELYRHGKRYHCLCSEYSRLFNEILQACGFQSRVIWLQGHVATEYFDPDRETWVYADCQLNVTPFVDERISTSELIERIEQDLPVRFVPLDRELVLPEQDYSTENTSQVRWLRNTLLNGECSAKSGDTLCATSRWQQLWRFRSRPTLLVLQTRFDQRADYFYPKITLHKVVICSALLLGVHLCLRWLRSDCQTRGQSKLPQDAK